ncbi:adhesion G protein-coupled receptor L4-like isoform X2 [Mercenaria mercenaria]|uniref:adhesion G protein-coupled receptor L4-like isoform X2 n=1 Tax=Mercenaria mercenaria TaxID=6596 RepID=UPI00234F183F|nr:adhesion G protein-coupled receptor L4-like isoform X2 [Mercenaria mercenaria]
MDCKILRFFILILVLSCYFCSTAAQFSECETDDACVKITESVCISNNCSCIDSDVLVGSACLYDCGTPQIPVNGNVSLLARTLQGDIAIYECDAGYRLVGNEETICARGGWDTFPPTCENGNLGDDCTSKPDVCDNLENAVCDDCGVLPGQHNGRVNITDGTEYNGTATYSCDEGFQLVGDKTRQCLNTGKWSGLEPSCIRNAVNILKCETDTDSQGTVWTEVVADNTRVEECAEGFTGNVTRTCLTEGKWTFPQYNCIRESVQNVNSKIAYLDNTVTEEIVSDILADINVVTTPSDDTGGQEKLTDGELRVLSSSLQKVAETLSSSVNILNDNITNDFIQSASNLIDRSNQESWKYLSGSVAGEQMLKAVDFLGEALSKTINSSEESTKVVVKQNIALEVKKFANADVVFPDPESIINGTGGQEINWITETQTSLLLDSNTLKSSDSTSSFVTTAVMYRDLSEILPPTTQGDSKVTNAGLEDKDEINAPVISLTISPNIGKKLDPPLKVTFEHRRKNLTAPLCVFWEFQGNVIETSGYWSTEGCKLESTNDNVSVCTCDHVTNFAVLMSPFREADASSKALWIISIVGIGVSMAFLSVTFGVYFILWKYLRNDRTTVLMNLCAALMIAYITFLSGVDSTESNVACALIAAVLQYIYLVVFCVMLVEGIDITIKVKYVFNSKSRVKRMLVLAWVMPAVIVGILLGASKLEGYGNQNFCWLSVDNGLVWAFVAPALLIISLNCICLVVVFHAMFKTKAMETKKTPDKIKTGLWSLCVLVPVLGVSWILGIFYINDSFYFVQYIFAILNGLQGFFIFLIHCFLNAQVKKAVKQLRRRRRPFKPTSKRLLKEDRSVKDSKGQWYFDSGGNEQDTSADWRQKALHPHLGVWQDSLQRTKPMSIHDAGRPSAAFSEASRDQLTGDKSLSYPEHLRGLSNHLDNRLFSVKF